MAEVIEDILKEEGIVDIITKADVMRQLSNLGVQRGMLLLIDADCTKLGYISGGVQVLIEALMETVGYEGTIVMPAFNCDNLDPAC